MTQKEKEVIEHFLAAAKMMPEFEIIQHIRRTLDKYCALSNEESRMELMMFMQLWSMKMDINKNGMIKAMGEIEGLFKLKSDINNSGKN